MKIKLLPATLGSLACFRGSTFWWQRPFRSQLWPGRGSSHPTIPCKLFRTRLHRAMYRTWNSWWQISGLRSWTPSGSAFLESGHREKEEEEEESLGCCWCSHSRSPRIGSSRRCSWWRRIPRSWCQCSLSLKKIEPNRTEVVIKEKGESAGTCDVCLGKTCLSTAEGGWGKRSEVWMKRRRSRDPCKEALLFGVVATCLTKEICEREKMGWCLRGLVLCCIGGLNS